MNNGLVAMLNHMLSNSTVTETSLEQESQINEVASRFTAGGLTIAANGQMHIHDFLVDILTIGTLGNTTVSGFANVTGTLQVGGAATFNGLVTANAALSVNGALSFNSSLSANGSVGTAGYALYSAGPGANAYWGPVSPGGNGYGTIQVAGQANLVAQQINAIATFVADGGILLTTNVASDGALHVGGVVANTTVQGDVSTAAQSFAGVKTFTENVAVSKALAVSGNVAVTGNTTTTGFVNIASTLQVTGLSTLTGNVTTGGFANIATSLQVGTTGLFNGLLTANAALTINGALTLNSTVSANGGVGVANQVLTSAGPGAPAYWANASAGSGTTFVPEDARGNPFDLATTAVVAFTAGVIDTTLTANGSTGLAGQMLTSGGTANAYWSTPTPLPFADPNFISGSLFDW